MKILNILILTLVIGVLVYVLFFREEPVAAPTPQAAQEATSDEDHRDEIMMEESNEGVDVVGMETELSEVVESDTDLVDTASAKVFTLDAFSFGYSEKEIRVKEGDTVTINLTNSGGYHDLVIDEFNVATAKIRQGETASVTFVADKTGTFEFYCSVGNHRAEGQVGKLIVD